MFNKIKEFFKSKFGTKPIPKPERYEPRYERYFSVESEFWMPRSLFHDWYREPEVYTVYVGRINYAYYNIYDVKTLADVIQNDIPVNCIIEWEASYDSWYSRFHGTMSSVNMDLSRIDINSKQFNVAVSKDMHV